jgi:Putative zinc-finger
MNCRRIAELIPLYVEGDLVEHELDRVRSHVQDCAACRARVAEYEASQAWLRAAEPPDFDEAFVDTIRFGVMRELAASEATPLAERLKRWLAPRRLAAATAALIVIFITLAFFIYQSRSRLNQHDDEMANGTPPPVEKKPDDVKPAPGAKPEAVHHTKRRMPHRVAPLIARHSRRTIQRLNGPQDHIVAQQPLKASPAVPSDNHNAAEGDEMLRIEFQTANPNIRIIWFAPKQIDDAPSPMGETR